jgi:2',3'-cyclic-nucleotide 2'-phosphodiesterase (5'-nucleotidase family)
MKSMASDMGVDMLLIDTGDLHDGTGLSDATAVDGELSMPIFNQIDFDLLTIGQCDSLSWSYPRPWAAVMTHYLHHINTGNHELYVAEDTEQMFNEYANKWGDRYITSNVKIYSNKTRKYEYIGATHRYFKTEKGLRIMAFGVLYDFTGTNRPRTPSPLPPSPLPKQGRGVKSPYQRPDWHHINR